MRHVHLGDARSAREHERLRELLLPDRAQHRLDRAPPIRVVGTAEVGDVRPGEAPQHAVDHARGKRPPPGVAPSVPRSARHVRPVLDRCDQAREVLGRVLEVAVHRHEDLAPRANEPRVHRGVLAEVLLQADDADSVVGGVYPLELREGRVGRAVVDEDQLEAAARRVERLDRPLVQLAQAGTLVVDRDHDRDRGRQGVVGRLERAGQGLLAGGGHGRNLPGSG